MRILLDECAPRPLTPLLFVARSLYSTQAVGSVFTHSCHSLADRISDRPYRLRVYYGKSVSTALPINYFSANKF
ncbi:hypothetical protein H6F74_09110 [Trichocoleus sp. FACHB-90]|uniref:hypothetical protein n=1 Tax=Cyanophyceae TaxID=3028117 RepID=UPI001684C140|nr:hypothetical protein [Trichocoleus sp. FACHB-90]MBD1926406.1 hypothetical protein [Trichocoleus sp. FACHB-90]